VTCIICGAPLPPGRQKYCSDRCEAEGNRRNAAERYRREAQAKQVERRVKLPSGRWFRCIYAGPDNETVKPHHEYSREAVRDFVLHGDPVDWFRPVG